MIQLLLNKYFIIFILIYAGSIAILNFMDQSLTDLLSIFICFGIILPLASLLLIKNNVAAINHKPSFKRECFFIIGLILFFTWYITYGTAVINKLIPAEVLATPWKKEIAVLIKKLVVFVAVPFFLYKTAGFTLNDFGFSKKNLSFSRKRLFAFFILSVLVLLYQYFFSGGAKSIRDGQFTIIQLIKGLPLLFAWLFIEAGLIEEFFFRAVLQSRISVLLKSPVAGILLSGLIFGLAHAPGLYLRGAESEGINEQLPFGFWAAYTISAMSLAGIFLGITWHRTKNIYLVMALHAMVDLLPNFNEFLHTWHI